jgi:hypothetical protein
MTEQGGGGNRGRRGPARGRGKRPGRFGSPAGGGESPRTKPRPGGGAAGRPALGLSRLADGDFELIHPRKVEEIREDYEEGIELWKEGDPEAARDALRYALSACHANLRAHVALGRIALDDFRDPTLARGHFGYALELGQRALPGNFSGRLSPDRPANRPFYEALDGLMACMKALGRHGDCDALRKLRARLSGSEV